MVDDLPLYVLLVLPLIAFLFLCLHRSTHARASGRPPPSPWALPVIGHIHHLAGALPHRAMRDLARRLGPLMLLRPGFTLPLGTGPVPIWAGTKPATIHNSNLNSKK